MKTHVLTTGDYTVNDDVQEIVVNKASGAATAITIPAPAPKPRAIPIDVIDGAGDSLTNNITITPVSGLINGAASYVLAKAYGSVRLIDNGTGWNAVVTGGAGASIADVTARDVTLRDTITTSGVGAPAGTGVTAVEYGDGAVHKTVITISALGIAITDNGASGGAGSQKVYDFPEGVIQLLGASYNLTTARVSTGLTATSAVVGSLGSVAAAADATLTSTEADMIASTTGTLTAGAGSLKKHGSLVATAFDGHTTPLDAILNIATVDAGIAANDTITINGTITLVWANLGDY